MPGWGDFQLLQIDAATEPYPDARPKTVNTGKRSIVPMVIFAFAFTIELIQGLDVDAPHVELWNRLSSPFLEVSRT